MHLPKTNEIGRNKNDSGPNRDKFPLIPHLFYLIRPHSSPIYVCLILCAFLSLVFIFIIDPKSEIKSASVQPVTRTRVCEIEVHQTQFLIEGSIIEIEISFGSWC
ncbi:hypothetical protein LINGRAHAP2_LOCUS22382 [Linum grandiflorum]